MPDEKKPKTVSTFPGAIKSCTCKNEYQDTKYGKGMRVANTKKDGNVRCTVCGKES